MPRAWCGVSKQAGNEGKDRARSSRGGGTTMEAIYAIETSRAGLGDGKAGCIRTSRLPLDIVARNEYLVSVMDVEMPTRCRPNERW